MHLAGSHLKAQVGEAQVCRACMLSEAAIGQCGQACALHVMFPPKCLPSGHSVHDCCLEL